MISVRERGRSSFDTTRRWWNDVMFTEESTASLAVFRILTGILTFGWGVTVIPDFLNFFGPEAVTPMGDLTEGRWSVLGWFDAPIVAILVLLLLIAGSVAVVLGWHTRIAAAVVLMALISFGRRTPWILNSGDVLLRNMAFFTMLAPGGAALSLTARQRYGTAWVFPKRAAWPRRLIQVQLSVIYLSTVLDKLAGNTWQDGTAVGFALRIEDVLRFGAPDVLSNSLLLANLLTYATIAAELALGILIWNKTLRPWLIVVGVLLHLSIDITFLVGFFSYGMITLYTAFVEPDVMEAALLRLRSRLAEIFVPREQVAPAE